jgi:hypothetical protein
MAVEGILIIGSIILDDGRKSQQADTRYTCLRTICSLERHRADRDLAHIFGHPWPSPASFVIQHKAIPHRARAPPIGCS